MTTAIQTPEISPASVKKLRKNLGMNRALFARLTGATERTVANWESATGEPRASSEKHLIQLFRVCNALLELVARDQIGPWFEKPNPAFNGLKPLEVIERGEDDRIWNMIFDLRAGTHA